jgi:hypothetical protein
LALARGVLKLLLLLILLLVVAVVVDKVAEAQVAFYLLVLLH